jgi:hypothetical protein
MPAPYLLGLDISLAHLIALLVVPAYVLDLVGVLCRLLELLQLVALRDL